MSESNIIEGFTCVMKQAPEGFPKGLGLIHKMDLPEKRRTSGGGVHIINPDECTRCGEFKFGRFVVRPSCYATGGEVCNLTQDKLERLANNSDSGESQ